MLRRKSMAFALTVVLAVTLAVGAPTAVAFPVDRPQASIIDSVLTWFGQIGEHLQFRAVGEGLGAVGEPEGTPQVSTKETVFTPSELAAPNGGAQSQRTLNYSEDDPPPTDELGAFGEPGG